MLSKAAATSICVSQTVKPRLPASRSYRAKRLATGSIFGFTRGDLTLMRGTKTIQFGDCGASFSPTGEGTTDPDSFRGPLMSLTQALSELDRASRERRFFHHSIDGDLRGPRGGRTPLRGL